MQCTCQQPHSAQAITITGQGNSATQEEDVSSLPTRPRRPYQQIVFSSSENLNRFEWVSSTQASQSSMRTRVRSHVMERFRAQQALDQQRGSRRSTSSSAQSSRSSEESLDNDPRIDYYYICRNCGRLNAEAIAATATNRRVESQIQGSLRTLPVDRIGESTHLYKYLGQVYAFIQNPVRRNGLSLAPHCFPFIVSSAAVLNALLSLAATHRLLVEGNNPDFRAAYYHHKIQTIQIINHSLSIRSDTVAYDIQTAIAVLAIIEYTTGSIENAQRHMSGLREVMAARGIINVAPADQHFALRLVNLASIITSNPLSVLMANTEQTVLDEALSDLPRNTHSSIPTMFHCLKQLSVTIPGSTASIAQESEWLDRVNVTEFEMHRVLETDLSPQINVSGGSPSSISFAAWRAYPISGTIYLCLMLRGLSINSNVFDYLVDSLVNAFQETMAASQNEEYAHKYEDEDEQEDDDDNIDRYPPNILLWLLFVGGAAAEGRQYRQWFLGQISRRLSQLRLDSWQETKVVLTVFPYIDECDRYFRKIWEEIEAGGF